MPGEKITAVQKAYAHLLRVHHNASYGEIAKKCKISKSSSHRICNMAINKPENSKKCKKKGRPRKLNSRNVRSLIRTLKVLRLREPNVSVKSLVIESGLSLDTVSRRTFSRILNENGYGFLQRRKKGILSERDRVLRRRFCRKVKRFRQINEHFWMNEVSFYIDGVSFIHKFNPMRAATTTGMARVWRKKGEGLMLTGKGSKDLAGGRRVHVMVAIAHGKGVILAEPYEKMNGNFFAHFIKSKFNICFAKAGPKHDGKRIFVMDNDPSQSSKTAMNALRDVEGELLKIPARSPDLNPIENIFHIVKNSLREDAIKKRIEAESFSQFQERVVCALKCISCNVIDKTIESLPKRVDAIIKSGGYRTKY